MLLVSSQCFEVLRAYVNNLYDDFVIHQALANPRKSQELKEFVHDIFHSETSALMREHNDIIQTQRDQILSRCTRPDAAGPDQCLSRTDPGNLWGRNVRSDWSARVRVW